MSDDDWDYFRDVRLERLAKRRLRLASVDDFGWGKYTEHHWHRIIDGDKLDYWPSSNKWLYRGKYYRGGLPKVLIQAVAADNERQRNDT